MSDANNDRTCHYPVCGYNPATPCACAQIRKAYGPCSGPCEVPCYIVAGKLFAIGITLSDAAGPQATALRSPLPPGAS